MPRENTNRALKQIKKAMPGDKLVFYLKSPVKAIVGIYEVASSMYVSEETLWKDRLFPYRVKIMPIRKVYALKNGTLYFENSLRLLKLIGKLKSLSCLAALQGRSMIPITESDFNLIDSTLRKKARATRAQK